MVVRLDYTDGGRHRRHRLRGGGDPLEGAARLSRASPRRSKVTSAAAASSTATWRDELEQLDTLAKVLRARRMARGSLDLEIAEPKVVLDADDPRLVRDVVKAKGDPAVKGAYQLVEEFMIAANEAVGAFFRKRNATTVWRVHAPPDPDRVAQLAELLGAYGIIVDIDAATTPRGMKDVLDQIAQKPGAQALSFLLLRTLTQAVWDTVADRPLRPRERRLPPLHVADPALSRSARAPAAEAPPPQGRQRVGWWLREAATADRDARAARGGVVGATSAARWKPSARRSRCTARS